MSGLQVAHVFEQLRPGGPLYALVGAGKHFSNDPGMRHRIISLLPADIRASRHAVSAGIQVVSAPDGTTLHRHLADADIVQIHFWNSPDLHALLVSDLPAMRVLVWCHVNGVHPPHVLPKSLFGFADVVAATSELTLDLPVFRAADPEQVGFVLAGADFSRVEGVLPVEHVGFNVGYVGLVDSIKMHPGFVRMCAAISVRAVRFIVCGGGQGRREIERQADALGIGDRFEFIDQTDDIRPVISRFDVFGYPLCQDSSCTSELVVQEVMYAGVPPVVFPYGGIARLVTHGRNAIVAQNETDYVEAIERLAHDPEERKRLGQRAASDARSQFGARKTAVGLAALYERLMDMPKRQRSMPEPVVRDIGLSPAAWTLVQSLDGVGDADMIASLTSSGDAVIEAEERIAQSSPNMKNVILQYRIRYPNDPHLRLWAGLMFAHASRNALAASEFNSCMALGYDAPRVRHYFSSVAVMSTAIAATGNCSHRMIRP